MGRPYKDLSGQIFGTLQVIKRIPSKTFNSRMFWLCRCSCGKEVKIRMDALQKQKSCGCEFRKETTARLTIHGYGGTRIYNIWRKMIDRCHNPTNNRYQYYGARGITVCEEWLVSFARFLEDMGEPPSLAHSIDRIDNNKGYYKENCRWATATEQRHNRRDYA